MSRYYLFGQKQMDIASYMGVNPKTVSRIMKSAHANFQFPKYVVDSRDEGLSGDVP